MEFFCLAGFGFVFFGFWFLLRPGTNVESQDKSIEREIFTSRMK